MRALGDHGDVDRLDPGDLAAVLAFLARVAVTAQRGNPAPGSPRDPARNRGWYAFFALSLVLFWIPGVSLH